MGEIMPTEFLVGDILSLCVFDRVWITEDVHTFSFGGLFSDEDIIELVELGEVLRDIRARLVAEGKMADNRVKH